MEKDIIFKTVLKTEKARKMGIYGIILHYIFRGREQFWWRKDKTSEEYEFITLRGLKVYRIKEYRME